VCICYRNCLFIEQTCTLEAVAVTSLDKELFALKKSSPQLDVYDAISFKRRGSITIPNCTANFIDIAACSFHHCVYILNATYAADDKHSKSTIIRLEMPSKHSQWKVENLSSDAAISVTSSHRVLVSFGGGSSKLHLFSTNGVPLDTVELHRDITSMNCAVELVPGQYVVTHGRDYDALHRICVVNSEGKILHTFGGLRGSHPSLLDTPSGVVVDKDGFVYVSDEKNNRLIVLTQDLNCLLCMQGVFPNSSRSNIHRTLKVDKESGRIYVGYHYWKAKQHINAVAVFEI